MNVVKHNELFILKSSQLRMQRHIRKRICCVHMLCICIRVPGLEFHLKKEESTILKLLGYALWKLGRCTLYTHLRTYLILLSFQYVKLCVGTSPCSIVSVSNIRWKTIILKQLWWSFFERDYPRNPILMNVWAMYCLR